MLTFEQWQEKSKSSLEAAQILIDNDKPVEAVSRAYYAVYQIVTGVLIKLNLNPRQEFGNWSHYDTIEMYRIHSGANRHVSLLKSLIKRGLL